MKHYIDTNNQIHGIGEASDIDGDQSFLVQDSWTLLTDEEFQAIVNPPLTEAETLEKAQQDITSAIQTMLDTKAQSMRYDNMMSARSYAGYPNPFQVEAQSLAVWGADCWARAGQIDIDVSNGKRPMPTVEVVLSEMPEL